MRSVLMVLFCILVAGANAIGQEAVRQNLLLNPSFEFHSFDNSRSGQGRSNQSGSVACWDQAVYGDVTVSRAPQVQEFRAKGAVNNVVLIHPGKTLSQFALLHEMGLEHGDAVSLSVRGHQSAPDGLQVTLHQMRADSQSGSWSPADFGQDDKRTFPKHARGELVKDNSRSASSGAANDFEVKLENTRIVGAFTESATTSTDQPNTVGLQIEFTNRSDKNIWIYSPSLVAGPVALQGLPVARAMPEFYRGIPRTIQKLWRGEPLHVIVMGSSIDRGSANPPQYLYDEDPKSPTFKQPISKADFLFDGSMVGHPEWTDYFGQWRHYFNFNGRLRRALLQKFDYPINKLLWNTMAADGSSISEAHSGFAAYASLSLPPNPETNGQRSGKTWQELYPEVFTRPEGSRPDLVIFGSGANEKIDRHDEIAAFEGAIRWFQRQYPGTEFLFGMWNNREQYSPNTGHLMELSLRYQIPMINVGRAINLAGRHANTYALTPSDGHPQAGAHYLWGKQLERAFDVADPTEPGVAQLHLPARISPYTTGWEGEVTTYKAGEPRIRNDKAFIFDDTVVNLWATTEDKNVVVRIDGVESNNSRRLSSARQNNRNSSFAIGRLSLGDRHVLETVNGKIVAVDAKTVLNRQWVGVESPRWQLFGARPTNYKSEWGAPYGSRQVVLAPGRTVELEVAATDISVAYVDQANGGTMNVFVDGAQKLSQPTNEALTMGEGKAYLENRRGIRGLPYGMHRVKIQAVGRPVTLLGVFTYDTRANNSNERVMRGTAYPGETVQITAPFQARPLVAVTGGLKVNPTDVTTNAMKFSGNGSGSYELVGE
jgi:hypothetical protein